MSCIFSRARGRLSLLAVVTVAASSAAADEPPRAVDERLKIELFAEQPQIATPTGIDVDHAGRVWAIESNTHFRPEGYPGHPTDRLLVLEDADGDHRADKVIVFADGFTHAMSVAVRPVWLERVESRGSRVEGRKTEVRGQKSEVRGREADSPDERNAGSRLSTLDSRPSQVFVATRAAILLLEDSDGDLAADRRETLVRLETKGNYPHNGLAGFAFDALGWMYFGFGENLGQPYKIVGSDGTTLSGGGEGGNVYRCRPDGSQLKLWATGFWNPHASCVDAFGRLFTVDNDADSRPPCRLLHVIEGGDYGYRFRNGRKGLHPFTSWNGEIPGTLPMVAGTGEAPSGIVAYESDGLPEDYLGNLLVTSWGDHRIDRFRLKPKGASFESLAEPIIQGGETFRPVGLALAPDGSLYCTDWVLRDYKLHGRGRVWRISKVGANRSRLPVDVAEISSDMDIEGLASMLESQRLDVRRRAAQKFVAKRPIPPRHFCLLSYHPADSPRARYELVCASVAKSNPRDRNLEDFHASEDFSPDATATAQYSIGFKRRFHPSDDIWKPILGRLWSSVGADRSDRDPALPLAIVSELEFGRIEDVRAFLDRADPFIFASVCRRLSEELSFERFDDHGQFIPSFGQYLGADQHNSSRVRLGVLIAARMRDPRNAKYLPQFLADPAPDVRRLAVQWVAEENLEDLRPQVEAVLSSEPMTPNLLLATIAALEMLDGVDPKDIDQTPAGKYVLPLVRDENKPSGVRAMALRLVEPTEHTLSADLFRKLLDSKDEVLRSETVRTLQFAPDDVSQPLLRQVANDETAAVDLRADAAIGLASAAARGTADENTLDLLATWLSGENETLRDESLRAMRGVLQPTERIKQAYAAVARSLIEEEMSDTERHELADHVALNLIARGKEVPEMELQTFRWQRPATAEGWAKLLDAKGDAAAGRRVFFHPHGPGCYKCHTVHGRGGNVGPDLSNAGRLVREKLVESILEPSKEIAPQFTTWSLVTAAGKVHTGMIVHEDEGRTVVGDVEGKTTTLQTIDIVERVAQRTSTMPEKLTDRMTVGEFRDLLAFLESLR